MFIKANILIAFLLFMSMFSFAQQIEVSVVDDQTGEACSYANVVISDLKGTLIEGGVADAEGRIRFQLDRRVLLAVSYIGYESIVDTIQAGEKVTIRLKTNMYEVQQVVITGQHQPKPVDQSIYKVDIVNASSMQQRGVNNLAEALSNETSIRLKVDPSTGTSIRMQGMGGENIKYLIDGVPLIGRVRGDIDLSQINMENVDHIEIVQGPMSVQYGTSAIAGVINIITKKNNYFSNLIKLNNYTDTKGNYNLGLYGSMIRKNHNFSVSGYRNIFQGRDIDLNVDPNDPDGHDRYMEFKPKLVYNGDIAYSFRKKDFRIELKSQYMYSLVKDYANYIEKVVRAYDNDYHTNRSITSISLNDRISENLSYNISAAYTWFFRKTDDITSDLFLLTKEITGSTSTVFNNIMSRGNFTYANETTNWSIMTGWDINIDNGSGDKLEEDAAISDYAVYISGQYYPIEKLALQPGIRMIYNSIYGAPLIPSMNLQWNLAKGLNFRTSYARGFRAPTLKELYLDFKDSNHDLSGNKDLKAETTNSYNSSLSYMLAFNNKLTIKSEAGFFFNDGKDAIVLLVTDQGAKSAININLGGRRTLGGELRASLKMNNLRFGLGFSRIGESFDEEGEGEYLPIVYYNNYSLNSSYALPKLKATLMSNLKIYGRTPVLTNIPEEAGGGYYRVFTDSYADLEFTFSKNLWKNRINLVLGAKNLLNVNSIITSGYSDFGESDFQESYLRPQNYGRTFFIKLSMKLSN